MIRDAIAVMGSMLYLMVFEGRNTESNRWGKHYTGWTIALFIITLLQETFQVGAVLFDFLYKIALVGALFFTTLSLFYYFKNQGKELYEVLFGE